MSLSTATWTEITAGVLLVTVFSLTIYDIVVARATGGDATISWCIYQWSMRYPFIAFAMGFLAGHLFGQMGKSSD